METTTYNINNANLKNYYPFDTDFFDYSSGTGVNNATTSNVTISTSNSKLTNGSLSLPGTTNQSFKLPTIQFAPGGLAVACWMKCNAIPGNFARLFDFAVPSTAPPADPIKYFVVGFGLGNSTPGKPYIAIGSAGEKFENLNYTITDSNWHHFAFVIQSNSVLNFYVDGTLITEVSFAYPPSDPLTSSFIGKTNWSSGGFPNCNINQFVIFNRPITFTEVSYLYNYPTQVIFSSVATGIMSKPIMNVTTTHNINNANLINYHPLDTNFLDYATGTGVNNATAQNVTISTFNPRLTNGSLLLTGASNEMFKLPTIQFASGGLAVACWMKLNATPVNYTHMFSFAVPATVPTKYFVVGFGLNGALYIVNGLPSNSQSQSVVGDLKYTISDFNWHHFAFVIQSNSVLNFYVDGTLITGVSFTSYPTLDALPSSLIGKTNWDLNGSTVKCNINQFVFFNRPITTTEVSYLYKYPKHISFSSVATGIISNPIMNGAFNLNTTDISQNTFLYVGTAGTGYSQFTFNFNTAGYQTSTFINTYFPNWTFFTRDASNNAILLTNGINAIRVTPNDNNVQALNVQQYQNALLIASQSIQLSFGTYVLTYRAGPRYDYYFSTQKLSTSISSSQFGTVVLKNSESFVAGWKSFTHTFNIYTSGVYSINFTFENGSGSGTSLGIGTVDGTSIALTDVNLTITNDKYPCFLQGSKILAMNVETDEEEYIPIENLRRGDLIKTVKHGYKAIELIGFREIPNPLEISKESSRLYWLRKSKIPSLREDLCVTGDHCVLYRSITDNKREQIQDHMGDIYETEGHYRVPAFLDDRAEPYKSSGSATIWHFALENSNVYHNYGVMANGLLVESNCIYCMYNDSNMELV